MNDLKNKKVIEFLRLYTWLALFYVPVHMAVLAQEAEWFSWYHVWFWVSLFSAGAIMVNLEVIIIGSKKRID